MALQFAVSNSAPKPGLYAGQPPVRSPTTGAWPRRRHIAASLLFHLLILFGIFLLPSTKPVSRLGIAATKKLGGAVQRNRAKRLIREVFRRNKIAPGFDVVVVPKRELLDASLSALEAEYVQTVERSIRRHRR